LRGGYSVKAPTSQGHKMQLRLLVPLPMILLILFLVTQLRKSLYRLTRVGVATSSFPLVLMLAELLSVVLIAAKLNLPLSFL
jgi:hypothetical protein